MPTYISLINWTDQGIQRVRDSPARAQAAAELATKVGANLTHIYWTVGPYDLVGILDAPDDESATAFALGVGSLGNTRTTTLRGYDRQEFEGVLGRLPSS